jgi:alcohol dehydrogenase
MPPGDAPEATTSTSNGDGMSGYLRPIDLERPGQIAFGPETAKAVGAWVAGKNYRRALVVSDMFNASRVGLLGLDCATHVFGAVQPEPDTANLDSLLAEAAAVKPDVIIGFGGGSAMDLAKLAAVLPGSGQTIAGIVGVEKVAGRQTGLVQVPTTSGTGSEAGSRSLVTDPATRAKLAVQSRHMVADLAVIDPDLTMTVPPAVTAATGVDALAHCVEAFTNRKAHPLIDLYALEGVRLVGRFLARAVADGADREARAGLSLASLYGGFALGPVNTAAGHALAYPLGTRYHVPHGAANALIFPHVLAYNMQAVPERTALILHALNLGTAKGEAEVLQLAYGFCAGLGIEMQLSRLGVPAEDLPSMASEAHAIRRLLDNNPRDIDRDAILTLYEAAF